MEGPNRAAFDEHLVACVEEFRASLIAKTLARVVDGREVHPGALSAAGKEVRAGVVNHLHADTRYQIKLDGLYWKREKQKFLALVARKEKRIIERVAKQVGTRIFGAPIHRAPWESVTASAQRLLGWVTAKVQESKLG